MANIFAFYFQEKNSILPVHFSATVNREERCHLACFFEDTSLLVKDQGWRNWGREQGDVNPAPPLPDFGSSVNPISTRREDCDPLSDFRNFRHPWGLSLNFRPRNKIRHRCILNGPVPVTVRGDVIENRLL